MKLFSANDIVLPDFKKEQEEQEQDYGIGLIPGMNFLIAKDLSLQQTLKNAKMGDAIIYHTDGKWSQHKLIANLLAIIGPSNLTFATWTLTEEPVRALFELKQQGLILSINALFDERIKTYSANGLQFASTFFDKIKMAKSHAKITILQNETVELVIIGSSNFSRNPRLEAGVIMYSKSAVTHFKQVIDDK